MCGIFFYLRTSDKISPPENFSDQDLFEHYQDNPDLQTQSSLYKPYSQNWLAENLSINPKTDFDVNKIIHYLQERGPDSVSSVTLKYFTNQPCQKKQEFLVLEKSQDFVEKLHNEFYDDLQDQEFLRVIIISSVQHLRGDKPTIQPQISDNSILAFNGEIFRINSNKLKKLLEKDAGKFDDTTLQSFELLGKFDFDRNDGEQLQVILDGCQEKHIQSLYSCMEGDFTIQYVKTSPVVKIFQGKDIYGKRSCLFGLEDYGLVISSVGWGALETYVQEIIVEKEDIVGKTQNEKLTNKQKKLGKNWGSEKVKKSIEDIVEEKYMLGYLEARKKKMIDLPPNSLLTLEFSVDDICDKTDAKLVMKYNFDNAVNQEFYNQVNVVGKFSESKMEENLIDLGSIDKQIVFDDKEFPNDPKNLFEIILNAVENCQQNSVKKLMNIPKLGQLGSQLTNKLKTRSKLAVLFSGGLDSTQIAYYLLKCMPDNESLDQINSAFSTKAADRDFAILSYQNLSKIFPDREINLILVNKTLDDINLIEKDNLDRIYPRNTHMDFNIGQVQHFTSEGKGVLYYNKVEEVNKELLEKLYEIKGPIIETGARVVFSGLGADEIFAGYKRYKAAYKRGGWEEHRLERLFDLKRLWLRNLGRDDRVISGRSKEARFPFLELDLLELVMSLPEEFQADYSQVQGDKCIQREIGLRNGLVSNKFDKRAMQFGSGVAKVMNVEKFGAARKGQGQKDYNID